MIYVTLGTMFLGFPRLVNAMDAIAGDTGETVILQAGLDTTPAPHCERFEFKSRDEVLALQRDARVVVCHAGIGCVSDALRMHRALIVVPRLMRYNEHMNDHQLDLASAVEKRGWGRTIRDVAELPAACANPPAAHMNYAPASAPLIADLRAFIDSVAHQKRSR